MSGQVTSDLLNSCYQVMSGHKSGDVKPGGVKSYQIRSYVKSGQIRSYQVNLSEVRASFHLKHSNNKSERWTLDPTFHLLPSSPPRVYIRINQSVRTPSRTAASHPIPSHPPLLICIWSCMSLRLPLLFYFSSFSSLSYLSIDFGLGYCVVGLPFYLCFSRLPLDSFSWSLDWRCYAFYMYSTYTMSQPSNKIKLEKGIEAGTVRGVRSNHGRTNT